MSRDYELKDPRFIAWKNRLFAATCWIVTGGSVVVLAVLLISIATRGLAHLDLAFLRDAPSRRPGSAGLGPALWGTVWICAVCAVVAIPLGVGTAIVMEEYKPRSTFGRKLHGFLQLNIANLAGVPSIVYGIIGLTVFVQFFGRIPSDNPITFGDRWFDEYVDEAGSYLRLPVANRDADTAALVDGLILFGDDGESIPVRLVPAEWEPGEPAVAPGTLKVDARPFRVDEKSWYFIQIPFGRGVLAGGLTLMLVILPIVIVSSQEALRAVPSSLRQAGFGLGATRWQVVRGTVLPAAVPGIMTGSILAMSRAIGEAAPILILAGIVYITFTPAHLMDQFTAMPLQIYDWAGRPQEEFHKVAASGIVVLLVVLLSFNALALIVRQKFRKPLS